MTVNWRGSPPGLTGQFLGQGLGSDARPRRGERSLGSALEQCFCAPADATARIVITMTAMNQRDADRLELLDRIAERVPELDLDQQLVEWTTLDDGHEALLVNGGGIDGGNGCYFACYRDDVHAVGSLAPIIDGAIGCVVIRPHGSRYVAR